MAENTRSPIPTADKTQKLQKAAEDLDAASSKSPATDILPVFSESEAINQRNSQNDCLTLEDATVEKIPVHLSNLLASYGNIDTISQAELTFLLVYTGAMESGFISTAEVTNFTNLIGPIETSSSFHLQNVRKFSELKPTFEYDTVRNLFFMRMRTIVDLSRYHITTSTCLDSYMKCIVTGDFLLVTVTAPTCGRSLCLSMGRYVLNVATTAETVSQRFRRLDELAYLLREKLFMPVRTAQLDRLGVIPFPSLTGLPFELYDEILQYLSQIDRNSLITVNKRLNQQCRLSRFVKKK